MAFAALGGGVTILLAAFAMSRKPPPAEPAPSFTPAAPSEIPQPFHRVHPPRPGTLGLEAGVLDLDAGDAAARDAGIQQFDTSFHPGDGPLVRGLDKVIFAYIGERKVTKNGWNRDVFPKESYRADMFRDASSGLVTKVQLDTNRNGKWDEIWVLTADDVTRKYSIDDDENYHEFTYLKMGRWAPSGERKD
jgi:hypothetical protein